MKYLALTFSQILFQSIIHYREPALSLGVAFQLTNILRDVGEDAKQRGRIYLPREDLERFGVTEEQIFAQQVDDKYRSMMQFQIERARMYYERARRGVFMLAEESRLPVQTSLDAYGRILDKIEENNYDSLTQRAYVDKWEKLSIIPFSWYRTTDVSRTFPLPGDKPVDLRLA
jgi:15-cis-phytoene synthase